MFLSEMVPPSFPVHGGRREGSSVPSSLRCSSLHQRLPRQKKVMAGTCLSSLHHPVGFALGGTVDPAHVLLPPSFGGRNSRNRRQVLCHGLDVGLALLSHGWARMRTGALVGLCPLGLATSSRSLNHSAPGPRRWGAGGTSNGVCPQPTTSAGSEATAPASFLMSSAAGYTPPSGPALASGEAPDPCVPDPCSEARAGSPRLQLGHPAGGKAKSVNPCGGQTLAVAAELSLLPPGLPLSSCPFVILLCASRWEDTKRFLETEGP